ncbi:MAG: hypothetical protein AAF913_11685, partial [Pseudomonadota bacterium]
PAMTTQDGAPEPRITTTTLGLVHAAGAPERRGAPGWTHNSKSNATAPPGHALGRLDATAHTADRSALGAERTTFAQDLASDGAAPIASPAKAHGGGCSGKRADADEPAWGQIDTSVRPLDPKGGLRLR